MRMIRFTPVEWIVFFAIAMILGNFGWTWIDEVRGRSRGLADSKRDLAFGVIGIKGCGKPMYWHRQYESILSKRFNAHYQNVGGCCPSPFDHAYIEAYNSVMTPSWQAKCINLDAVAEEARSLANKESSRN